MTRHLFSPVVLILVCSLTPATGYARARATKPTDGPATLMQFTAGRHILGFASDSLCVAAPSHALRVKFVGARDVVPQSDSSTAGVDGKAGPLSQVRYVGLWDGVTLRYDAVVGGIAESTYTLQPGADVRQICLRYNVPLEIDAAGELVAALATGQMRESRPLAWQNIGGRRVAVNVSFRRTGEREVGFSLGRHNPDHALTIDPTLTWNTFLGGTGDDEVRAIAVDGSGNVYVGGRSYASWGSPVRAYTGGSDAFVAKLAGDGSLTWNTFLSGNGGAAINGVAVDNSGNVYAAGGVDASWGTPVRAYTSGADAFAAKLAGDGSLTWHTFLGGSGPSDNGYDVAVDSGGNVYVVGRADATWGVPVRAYAGGLDIFAAKLAGDGSLTWNTFLGYGGTDHGNAVAVDGGGNVYVGGWSYATWGAPVRAYSGGQEGVAAKLASDGSLTWHTFLGGSGSDSCHAIAVDGGGNVYAAGASDGTWAAPVNGHAGSFDVYAAKLAGDGSLTWSTFLGGSSSDQGRDMALDGSGNVYVAGFSNGTWGSPARAYTSGDDCFVAAVASNGSLSWNTFLGDSGNETGRGIAVDGGGVYVGGHCTATWGTPVRAYVSGIDGFAAKLSVPPTVVVPTLSEWGVILLGLLLAGRALLAVRRRSC